MSVTMYDCGFGDGFLIDEYVDRPLLVDFGVCFSPKVGKYTNVINEIGSINEKDFLLTHFHFDHVSGMLHWKKYLKMFPMKNHVFENVYIPAINNVSVIKVLLLGNLGKRNSLLDFLTVFCRLGGRGLRCVGTGDKISGLTVLWPDADPMAKGSIVDYANRFLEQINLDRTLGFFSVIDGYSERLYGYINEMYDSNFDRQDEVLHFIREIKRTFRYIVLDDDLSNLVNVLDETFVEVENGDRIYLNQYAHICNIVFHNTKRNPDKGRNILFTGDVEKRDMKIISLRKDPKIKLHSKYDVIKIPHHGTDCHHFDFKNLCNLCTEKEKTVFLIPNGVVPIKKVGWETSDKYNIVESMVCTTDLNRVVHAWGRAGDRYVPVNDKYIL